MSINKYTNLCASAQLSGRRSHCGHRDAFQQRNRRAHPRPQRRDQFAETVTAIAEEKGFDPQVINALTKAHNLSSSNFCGIRSPYKDQNALMAHDHLPRVIVDALMAHYHLRHQGPFQWGNLNTCRSVLEHETVVYIVKELTDRLLNDQSILEKFDAPKRLYQFLNWTIRINKRAQTMALMEGQNGCNVLLVHTELHDQRRRDLYALCIQNDIVSPKAQKWQLAALLTAPDLTNLLGVDNQSLPHGVRATAFQFKDHRRMLCGNSRAEALRRIKQGIMALDRRSKLTRYQQLKCVATNAYGTKTNLKKDQKLESILEVKLSTFGSNVRSALKNDKVQLIPIVSIVAKMRRNKRHANFSVDYLLPVQIGQDCVGVVYRGGVPTQALMDCYDIANKALLCDPSFDTDSLSMFPRVDDQRYDRLRVVPDDEWTTLTLTDSLPRTSMSPRPPLIDMSPITSTLSSSPSLSVTPESKRSTQRSIPLFNRMVNLPAPVPMSSPCKALGFVPLRVYLVPVVATVTSLQMPLSIASTNEVLQWTQQILTEGEQNLWYYKQYLAPSMSLR